ncbi:MAG TPA: hypothetical protein VMF67_04370 [Rhizomicrobium sp.]|nr:hypothetical protein [Rhizomicrobium sp.]
MTKPLYTALPFLLLFAGTPAALSAVDSPSVVLSDCGSADLPDSKVDSCLERVRVLDETDPSLQLQSLEAKLEQRAIGGRSASRQPRSLQLPANPQDNEVDQYSAQRPAVETANIPPPTAAEPDASQSAADTERAPAPDATDGSPDVGTAQAAQDSPPPGINYDQPPVADPPDSDSAPGPSSDPPQDSQ